MANAKTITLVGPKSLEEYDRSAVTFSCRLSPEISAVDMEIRWFKETDCVCVYKNKEVTERKGYRDRVSINTEELDEGNVSLQLRNCTDTDFGCYPCQVIIEGKKKEITLELMRAVPELVNDEDDDDDDDDDEDDDDDDDDEDDEDEDDEDEDDEDEDDEDDDDDDDDDCDEDDVWVRKIKRNWTKSDKKKMDKSVQQIDAEFMDHYREKLIQRVSAVMEMVDSLKSKIKMTNEDYKKIHAQPTSCEQMRILYMFLDAGGTIVKAQAYKVLKEKEPYLLEDLSED